MNRVAGDYFENLLYKIFVSMDERTSVEKLAKVLDIDIELAKVNTIELFYSLRRTLNSIKIASDIDVL